MSMYLLPTVVVYSLLFIIALVCFVNIKKDKTDTDVVNKKAIELINQYTQA